jgi:hypothetical protein
VLFNPISNSSPNVGLQSAQITDGFGGIVARTPQRCNPLNERGITYYLGADALVARRTLATLWRCGSG